MNQTYVLYKNKCVALAALAVVATSAAVVVALRKNIQRSANIVGKQLYGMIFRGNV